MNYKAITLLLCSFLAFPCLAQDSPTVNPRFEHITIDDGLSQGLVWTIHQDRRGFMWFGTKDGLNRYDGYNFVVFRHDPFDSTTISGNSVTAIFEDSRGKLWFGTQNSGLNCFDPATETFHRFKHDPENLNSLSSNFVTAICEAQDPQGTVEKSTTLWIGTVDGGVNKLVLTAKGELNAPVSGYHFTRYLHDSTNPGSLSHNGVYDLLVDRSDVLWVGTENGLNQLAQAAGSGKNPVSQNQSFVSYFHDPENSGSLLSPKRNSLLEGRDGELWFATPRGLSQLSLQNRSTGRFSNYPHTAGSDFYSGTPTNEISEAGDGRLWLATEEGLAIFNRETATYQYIQRHEQDPSSLSFNKLRSVFQDDSGAIWVGTNGLGVNKYDPKQQRFQNYTSGLIKPGTMSSFSIGALLQDRSRRVWFFCNNLPDNVYKLDRLTGMCTSIPFGSLGVTGILEDGSGNIWFTARLGLARYDNVSGRIRYILPRPGEKELSLNSLYEDPEGNIWLAGNIHERLKQDMVVEYTSTLLRWQPQTETLTTYPLAIQEMVGGYSMRIPKIVQRGSDTMFLASNRGLIRFDPASGAQNVYRHDPQNPSSLNHNVLKTLLPDPLYPERYLWLGTDGGGLNRFEYETETFTHYTLKDGLPNNVVYGILADDYGDLWMSTNKGIAKAILSKDERIVERFRNYDQRDGLQSNEFNTGSYSKAESGEMLFGGIKGFNIFHPDSIKDNPHIPPVVFTDFQIRYQSVDFGEPGSPLQKHISATEAITLPYSDNVFSFEFAALDYSVPEKNLYSFKLENFNKEWSKPGSERKALYTNLNPGNYVFRVRGSNADGVWNEEGATIKITITPPWWRTWWAYSLYGLFLFSAFYSLHRYEKNRQKHKHKAELRHVETRKLKELDKLKSDFFANISHEFRTPLTLILGPTEQLMEEVTEGSKKKLSMVRSNAQSLLRLINQLLDVSKLESGKMPLQARPGDFMAFLKGVVMSFESWAQGKGITLLFEVEEQAEKIYGQAYFDREKAEKIFSNLLSNALKFTPEGESVKVTLAISKTTAAVAEITVRDTGVGIPPDRLSHIFDRFSQVDTSSTRAYEGTGIGLALAKELVELHHGTITVASEEGQGTCFTICLPLGKANLAPRQLVDIPPGPPSKGGVDILLTLEKETDIVSPFEGGLRGMSEPDLEEPTTDRPIILIIEDNADVRAYIREQLQTEYTILEAGDGEAGITQAIDVIPDLVISDVMMPKKDGFEVCRTLKTDERTSHIPVILLTAKAQAKAKLTGLETGADAYVLKPFRQKELAVRVRKLIELRRKLRARFSKTTVIKPSEVSVVPEDQAFLTRVVAFIEAHLEEESFTITHLCREIGLSERQLERKLKALIGQSPTLLVRSLRLRRAKQLLEQNAGTVSEIAFQVGFNNLSYFSKIFREQFDRQPSDIAGSKKN